MVSSGGEGKEGPLPERSGKKERKGEGGREREGEWNGVYRTKEALTKT